MHHRRPRDATGALGDAAGVARGRERESGWNASRDALPDPLQWRARTSATYVDLERRKAPGTLEERPRERKNPLDWRVAERAKGDAGSRPRARSPRRPLPARLASAGVGADGSLTRVHSFLSRSQLVLVAGDFHVPYRSSGIPDKFKATLVRARTPPPPVAVPPSAPPPPPSGPSSPDADRTRRLPQRSW